MLPALIALGSLGIIAAFSQMGCGGEKKPDPNSDDAGVPPNDRSSWGETEYRQANKEAQKLLRTSPTYFKIPDQARAEKFLYSKFMPVPPGFNGVIMTVGKNYPYHPAQFCRSSDLSVKTNVDFNNTPVGAYILRLAALSINNVGGDEPKTNDIHRVAGRPLGLLTPLQAPTLSEALKECPPYSPLRPQSTDEKKEKIELTGAFPLMYPVDYPYPNPPLAPEDPYALLLNPIRENAIEYSMKFYMKPMPTDEEMNFLVGWEACMTGIVVEFTPVGAQYTHIPETDLYGIYDEDDPAQWPQGEYGGWPQTYYYEDRPIVPLDNSLEGFSENTPAFCVRALETEPTAHLQAPVEVAKLLAAGEVTLQHDDLDPRKVKIVYGPEGRKLHEDGLFAMTITAEKKQ